MARPRSRHGRRGSLGERLRAARAELGVNQRQAAVEIGVGVASIARWETGSHSPRGLSMRAVEAWIAKGGKRRGS